MICLNINSGMYLNGVRDEGGNNSASSFSSSRAPRCRHGAFNQRRLSFTGEDRALYISPKEFMHSGIKADATCHKAYGHGRYGYIGFINDEINTQRMPPARSGYVRKAHLRA